MNISEGDNIINFANDTQREKKIRAQQRNLNERAANVISFGNVTMKDLICTPELVDNLDSDTVDKICKDYFNNLFQKTFKNSANHFACGEYISLIVSDVLKKKINLSRDLVEVLKADYPESLMLAWDISFGRYVFPDLDTDTQYNLAKALEFYKKYLQEWNSPELVAKANILSKALPEVSVKLKLSYLVDSL